MSKNIEKLAKEKDLEKIKPEKEKHEPKEFKDKDHKDFKDRKDNKEHKEHKEQKDNKEHKEHKDFKDRKEILKAESKEINETTKDFSREKEPKEVFEKDVKELEGKDLVEQPGLPDLSGQPVSTLRADAPSSIAKAAEKQIDKIKAEKEFTKHEPKEIKEPKEFKDKDFKDHKDQKDNKEHKEQKDNKEHKEHKDLKDRKEIHKELGREVNKDFKEFAKELEKFPKEIDEKGFVETGPEIPGGGPAQSAESTTMEARLARLEGVAKQLEKAGEKNLEKKLEKLEGKDKIEKIEHKDKFEKFERKEKFEIKEFKIEKPEHGKEFIAEKLLEVGIDPGPLGPDPAKFEATGTVEERVSRLENALLRMSHFIGVDLRPDLSAGALNREPDVAPPPPTKPSVAPPPPTKPDVAPPPPTKTEPNKPK